MNKENMAEQQENKDWLDKLGEFFSKIFINPDKDIAYSIRKRGNDEIEIRDSIFDGYARGFIRFILFAGFLIERLPYMNTTTYSEDVDEGTIPYENLLALSVQVSVPNYQGNKYRKKSKLTKLVLKKN